MPGLADPGRSNLQDAMTQTATDPAAATRSAFPADGRLRGFLQRQFTNFNSRELVAAAEGYEQHLKAGGNMMVTLAGAMSTAGIGRTLAELIRQGKVQAITCTGANLEEDVFLLLAGKEYELCPAWRALSSDDEAALYERGFNRVTDTCIPETVMRHMEHRLEKIWERAQKTGERFFPHEFFYEVLDQPDLAEHFQLDPDDSWLLAAKQAGIPVYTPGWEDSTIGNIFTAWTMRHDVEDHWCLRTGTEQMAHLARWYRAHSNMDAPDRPSVGFFQIGGGIAGDFPICVVPMMIQDLKWDDTRYWGYFCQISDATTSFGGYSGAVPNEKITWGKLDVSTPKFMIQSDATIVAPLIFAYVLGL